MPSDLIVCKTIVLRTVEIPWDFYKKSSVELPPVGNGTILDFNQSFTVALEET